jgi:hypothetical protein
MRSVSRASFAALLGLLPACGDSAHDVPSGGGIDGGDAGSPVVAAPGPASDAGANQADAAPAAPGPCGSGAIECDGFCVDPLTDRNHCGGCGNVCLLDCDAGQCGCADGLTACGFSCVDLTSNKDHCGSCDNSCQGGDCVAGRCGQCPDGGACDACPYSWLTRCDGQCVYLQVDPYHCGGCDVSCPAAGGETPVCVLGACSAVLALAESEDAPTGIALDDAFVYWTTGSGAIRRAPKGGGVAPITVADPGAAASSLVVAGDRLVFVRASTGTILSVAKDGSTHDAPTRIADGEIGVVSVAVAGGVAYWGTAAGVRSAPLGGGAAKTLVSDGSAVTFVATDGVSLDWVEPSAIYSASLGGAAPKPALVASVQPPTGITLVGGALFASYVEPTGDVALVRIDGPSSSVVHYGFGARGPLATDGVDVAWADDSDVWEGPFAPPSDRIVFDGHAASLGAGSVAMDASYVFVARAGSGEVSRVRR